MITIIAGTNRADSMTMCIAQIYKRILSVHTSDVKILSLEGRCVWVREAEMLEIEQQFLVPAEKFVFVMPEYNSSFPGILKTMMDNTDIKKVWWHKKAALTGLSDGRAGNIRGLEHMTSILNYLKVNVLYNKVPLSKIREELDGEGNLLNAATEEILKLQMQDFVNF
jgi:chromate reductase, NAD(P)H dehydrogenase (quinone)